jgi:hypothetical protein
MEPKKKSSRYFKRTFHLWLKDKRICKIQNRWINV